MGDNRLPEANYSNGNYYHYAYDAVGNRETQTTLIGGLPSTTNYIYDDANRLSSVNVADPANGGSVNYTWDNNGNASTRSERRLLNDGTNTYTGVCPECRAAALEGIPPID